MRGAGAVCAGTAAGTRTGVLTVYGNVAGGQATAALSGTATPPASVVLTPLALSYRGYKRGGYERGAECNDLEYGGDDGRRLQTPVVTGDFQDFGKYVRGVRWGRRVGCTLSIVFAPTVSAGTRTRDADRGG